MEYWIGGMMDSWKNCNDPAILQSIQSLPVVVPDVQPLNHENRVFSDIGCMVADPLQIAGNQK
jgi:hypothetical protein